MKQEYKNKFECKIILNKCIDENQMNKDDFEFVIKHILKCNLLLVKHYNLIKKYGNLSDILDECNDLLEYKFFINDKILIIWLARRLNKLVKDNYDIIGIPLKVYLEEKYKTTKDNRKYSNQREKANRSHSVIICDDSCWNDYLPTSKSEYCYEYGEEKDILYPQFDEELEKLSYSYDYNIFKLTKKEIENISWFEFCYVNEEDLIREITECINKFKENKSSFDNQIEIEFVLRVINYFENVDIRININSRFWSLIDRIKFDLFDLMKDEMFNYNVNDDFFIVDKNENGKVIEIISLNDISSFIDIPRWIKYMNSHNIQNLDEMYIDKEYEKD